MAEIPLHNLRLMIALAMLPIGALVWIATRTDERDLPPVAAPPPVEAAQVPVRGPQPQADLASYIGRDDYPPSALQAREQGEVEFILAVRPDGRVTDCQVTESSGSAALDSATCRIMLSRARYTPAIDAKDRPIGGTDVGEMRWVLP